MLPTVKHPCLRSSKQVFFLLCFFFAPPCSAIKYLPLRTSYASPWGDTCICASACVIMHVWVTNAVPPLHPSPCVAAARCRVLSKSPHTSFVRHECQRALPPTSSLHPHHHPVSPRRCHFCPSSASASRRDSRTTMAATTMWVWPRGGRRDEDEEGGWGGGESDWRTEPKVRHKDKLYSFVVHFKKESGPLNKATDGRTFPHRLLNQSRTLFSPSLSIFNKGARLLQGNQVKWQDSACRGGRTLCREKCGKACFSCRWKQLVLRNQKVNKHAGRLAHWRYRHTPQVKKDQMIKNNGEPSV